MIRDTVESDSSISALTRAGVAGPRVATTDSRIATTRCIERTVDPPLRRRQPTGRDDSLDALPRRS
ncbi:hypothetical protein GCM10023204_15690 [Actinomycetospora succinea]